MNSVFPRGRLVLATLLLALAGPAHSLDDTEMVSVPAGQFTMGCNPATSPIACAGSQLERLVFLDAYQIDKYKVTYRRYNACKAEGKCTDLYEGGGCNAGMSWNADTPVNCVNYEQAEALCEAEGKRLPTEAEWEKAARGTDGRTFPWGNQPASCERAVMSEQLPGEKMAPGCGRGTTRPVGSKPAGASPYGAMDMEGNLWEWTRDWFAAELPANPVYHNPTGPAAGEHKVLKSSSWMMRNSDMMASSIRASYSPRGQGYVVGFRCVKPGS